MHGGPYGHNDKKDKFFWFASRIALQKCFDQFAKQTREASQKNHLVYHYARRGPHAMWPKHHFYHVIFSSEQKFVIQELVSFDVLALVKCGLLAQENDGGPVPFIREAGSLPIYKPSSNQIRSAL